ncbi:molecular chaperone [Metamycoplasma cloacale]|uniref:Uncharacterized protein n=1 Tax=Metamycoplasma cloacale TaxID=92401 RepID=A0A2Z4LME5_9BACT|nr:hypothetical protein [Metamycoplasma cloacale]AWX42955.1 hypothetical protein DK849_02700 [Metamycoplasma cloacale]VEU79221.1 molecular chaperone [Metamycoplasma cloacale]
MELFIETSLSSLFLSVAKNKKILDYIEIKNLVKKTDVIIQEINKLLNRNNLTLQDIKVIKTTIGPGSFSGARIGFLWGRTIAQLSHIKLYICETYALLHCQNKLLKKNISTIRIKANKYSSYEINFKKNNVLSSSIVENVEQNDELDYDFFVQNYDKFNKCFRLVESFLDIELCYMHEPQIGGIQ